MEDELELQIQKEAARQGLSDDHDTNGADANNPPAPATPSVDDAPAPEAGKGAPAAADKPNDNADSDTPGGEGDSADQNKDKGPGPAFNANDFFSNIEQLSGGTFKTKDEFDAAVTKAKEFDSLQARLKHLESQQAISPYADDYEKQRNELKRNGATREQLRAFEAVNDLGDLNQMDAKEALVMKMILVDKTSEKVARLRVDRDFNMEGAEEDDLLLLQDDLEKASTQAKEALAKFKVEVSTPNQDRVLLDAAGKEQLASQLKPTLDEFTQKVNSLATVSIPGKKGEQAVNVDLDLSADDKAFITSKITEIMTGEGLPLTQENYNYAVREARRDFLDDPKNLSTLIEKTWNKAAAHFEKYYAEKYEHTGPKDRNKGDLKPEVKVAEDQKAFDAWKKSMLD